MTEKEILEQIELINWIMDEFPVVYIGEEPQFKIDEEFVKELEREW